ncbi:protein cortex [Xylocopa sonorina]|uniref:protein cortex n=1 Tax=Xylocopa sonorina TaxID=1818115 RepID=UPI00403A9189
MHQLMAKENMIPGLGQKEVLRGGHLTAENKLPGSLAGRPKVLWDEGHLEDGIWRSKPRNRPLIGVMDSMLDMPGFRTLPRYCRQLVDWGSSNIIAAVIRSIITFYDARTSDIMEILENVEIADACALKWNHAGTKTIVCTLSSEIKLYCLETQKVAWTVTCKCVANYNVLCCVSCICWSQDDQNIVTGCKGFITVYSVNDGTVVRSIHAHATKILALAFSSNYLFLVSSATDMEVRIFQWPSLSAYLDITYYEPVCALAWHPYQNGYLCIGGGVGDASLSLWNVNKLNPANYRHVNFHGAVENLAWNKHSGELIVHWSYWEGHKRYNVIPVFTSLDHIVDAIPVEKELQVNAVIWNPDHTQLAVQHDECLSIWNFFGNEYQYQKEKKQRKTRKMHSTGATSFNTQFRHFNIR